MFNIENQKSVDSRSALRYPEFRLFLGMRVFFTLATQILSVAVGWQIYDLTNSKLALGLIGLTEAVAAIGISLYAGHIADKLSRRNILLGCISTMFFCCAVMLGLAIFRDSLPREWLIGGIFSVVFLVGIARGFFSPANFSFLPQLVSREHLANGIVWSSSAWEVASITGLGLGGLIYGFFGVVATYSVMTALCCGALFFILKIAPHPAPPIDDGATAVGRIREGLRFVFSNHFIITTITLDLFAVLFGGAVALLPVFAKDILHVGPTGLGILRAAMSIGAISMAMVLAKYPLGRGAGQLLFGCVAGFGLCMIGFALSKIFWLSFAFLVIAGMCDEVSVNIRASLVHFATPENMKGRVAAVSTIFITSSNEIGAFESGLAASLMGTVPSVVFGGCMTLLVVAGVAWWSPALRNLDFNQILRGEKVRE